MKRRKHRGLSIGTISMLCLSVLVLVGSIRVLSTLSGDSNLHLTESLSSLDFSGVLPERTIDDIPIQNASVSTAGQPVQAAVTATPVPVGGQARLTFGGTVAAETAVRQSGYYSDTRLYDFSEIFSLLSDEIRSDYSLVVMENLVVPDAKVSDLIAPDEIMGMLRAGGFDGVALGFGKIYDKGFSGLTTTVQAAQEHQMDVLGAYMNEGDAALSNRIRMIGNIRIAFLHYTETLSSTGRKSLRKDSNSFAVPLLEQAAQDIAVVRSQGAQVVIVSVNWGTAGKTEVTKAQKTAAAQLCAAGADVIIGNGPRRVQTVERITATDVNGQEREALCAYSLGCLLSSSTKTLALQSILLHMDVRVDANAKVQISASYTPTFIWRYKHENVTRFRVIPANGGVPDGMSSDQLKKMSAVVPSVEKILKDAAVVMEQ